MKITKLLILFLSSFILSSCLLELHGTTFYESKPWIQFTPKEKLSVPINELINASEYITIDGERFEFITGNIEKGRYNKYSYEKNPIYFIKTNLSDNFYNNKKAYDYLTKENIRPTKAWLINILDDKYFETTWIYKDKPSNSIFDKAEFEYKFDSPKDTKGYFKSKYSHYYGVVQFESNNKKFLLKSFTNDLTEEELDYIKKEVKNENK